MLRHLLKYLSILTSFIPLAAQTPAESTGIEAYPAASAGLPIRKVVLLIDSKSHHEIADSTVTQGFANYFGIYPGAAFNQSVMSAAISRLERDPRVNSASCRLYQSNLGGSAELSDLKSKHLGDELTLQASSTISRRFMPLGVSWAFPGSAIKLSLPTPVKCWQTYQASLFMFF